MGILGFGNNVAKLYETSMEDRWRSIDTGIRPFVRVFNQIPGLQSHSSCSGHYGDIGEVYDGWERQDSVTIQNKTKRGPTIIKRIDPHLAFTGDTKTAVDYLNFLGYKIEEHGYRGAIEEIFQFTLDRGVWQIKADCSSRWEVTAQVGYWELMANWEMLRRFTVEYINGAAKDIETRRSIVGSDVDAAKSKYFDPHSADGAKNWRNLEHLISQLERVEGLNRVD